MACDVLGVGVRPSCRQAMRACYRFSTGLTDAGKMFDKFVGTLIVLNVVAVIAESEPYLGNMPGPAGERVQLFFDIFEASRRRFRASLTVLRARSFRNYTDSVSSIFPSFARRFSEPDPS